MADTLTLMAVHAHPDDEASSTGGVLARYSAEGVRTVVVTCTNGEFGDAPGGIKPGEEGHDEQVVLTYDPEGGYEHPDHVHASLSAAEAVRLTGIPAKLYLTAMPVSKWRE